MALAVEELAPHLQQLYRFRTDLSYYSHHVLKIEPKVGYGVVPLDFNYAQQLVDRKLEAQRLATKHVRAVILKARQEGISTYVAGRYYRDSTLWSHMDTLIIADSKDRAGIIHEIYERFDRHHPHPPARRYSQKRTEIVYDHPTFVSEGLDSGISVAVGRKAGRAATVRRLHATELAFWENPEDTWVALMGAIPSEGSEIIVESTANGVGNLFHRLWLLAESGSSEWLAIFLPWWIHAEYQITHLTDAERELILATDDEYEQRAMFGGFQWEGERWYLTPEQIEWRRRTIANDYLGDTDAFAQEFPSSAEEAFIVTGANFFDPRAVREYYERAVPPKDRGNLVHRNGVLMFAPARRGYLRVWDKPRADGRYVIWADTAEGKAVAARMQSFSDADADKGDRDFCSAHVFDVDRGAYVAVLHGRMAPEMFGEALYRLGFYYSSPVWKQRIGEREPAYMAVERNHSSGQTVISMLLDELEYPKSRFHRHRRLNKIKGTFTTSWGFVTDSDTRPTMLDDFARAIRERRVELPDRATINEMLTFVRNDAGRPAAMEGTHDDRVMSAAGCLAIAHLAPALPERPKPSPAPKKRRTPTPTGWEADYEVSVGT